MTKTVKTVSEQMIEKGMMQTNNPQVPGCYCSSLVGSRCDFCTGTRVYIEPKKVSNA